MKIRYVFGFRSFRAVYGAAQYQCARYQQSKNNYGKTLQTSDIGSKKWKQDMNQLFGKFIKTSLLNEP